jgi:hypothetical protein
MMEQVSSCFERALRKFSDRRCRTFRSSGHCSAPQDLWVGSAAGLRSLHNAKAAKEMYCVAACECEVPRDVKGVHRPPSHDDVHDDDEARSTMTTVINSAGAEWSDCILKRFRTRPHLLRCQGAFLKFGATRVTPLPRCILALGIRVRMKLHTVPRHCVSESRRRFPASLEASGSARGPGSLGGRGPDPTRQTSDR